ANCPAASPTITCNMPRQFAGTVTVISFGVPSANDVEPGNRTGVPRLIATVTHLPLVAVFILECVDHANHFSATSGEFFRCVMANTSPIKTQSLKALKLHAFNTA